MSAPAYRLPHVRVHRLSVWASCIGRQIPPPWFTPDPARHWRSL